METGFSKPKLITQNVIYEIDMAVGINKTIFVITIGYVVYGTSKNEYIGEILGYRIEVGFNIYKQAEYIEDLFDLIREKVNNIDNENTITICNDILSKIEEWAKKSKIMIFDTPQDKQYYIDSNSPAI